MRFLQLLIAVVVGLFALAAALIGAIALAIMALIGSFKKRLGRSGRSRSGQYPVTHESGDVIDVVAREVQVNADLKGPVNRPVQPTHARAL